MSLPAVDPEATVARAHQRAQQMRELFAHRRDVVALAFEQLQQRSQMRGRERRATAVVGLMAVNEIVHAPAEVLRVQLTDVRLMVQAMSGRTPRTGPPSE